MKPSLGRIVLTYVDPTQNNGADVAPAVITRVWSDTVVNLRVLVDTGAMPLSKTSVVLLAEQPAEVSYTCWWPPRV